MTTTEERKRAANIKACWAAYDAALDESLPDTLRAWYRDLALFLDRKLKRKTVT